MDTQEKTMTLTVFSNELDKAMAAFILATGAVSSGIGTTIFFTFWGLSLLRKKEKTVTVKGIIEKMFGIMLPKGPEKTILSKMNFFGAGTWMMKHVMRKKKMLSLESLMAMAQASGVKFIACTTSMGVMGIKKEELIDGVELGGVATYLGEAKDSSINLFI